MVNIFIIYLLIQALVVIFARLMLQNLDNVVNFLESKG